MIKKRSLLSGVLVAVLFSCGLPQTTLLEPPKVGGSSLTTLSFIPVAGVERYVLMYKFYWPNESTISSDRNVFSGGSLSPGVITPQSLGFIQMKKSAGSGGSYPVDSGEITLTGVTGQVILDFSAVFSTVQITGANETFLYRRVLEKKRDGSAPESSAINGKTFFNKDYDFLGLTAFASVVNGSGIAVDSTGLDGDIFRLFNNPNWSEFTSPENGDIIVAVVVYSNSYDATNGGLLTAYPFIWVPLK
jgi:hypothetical protein